MANQPSVARKQERSAEEVCSSLPRVCATMLRFIWTCQDLMVLAPHIMCMHDGFFVGSSVSGDLRWTTAGPAPLGVFLELAGGNWSAQKFSSSYRGQRASPRSRLGSEAARSHVSGLGTSAHCRPPSGHHREALEKTCSFGMAVRGREVDISFELKALFNSRTFPLQKPWRLQLLCKEAARRMALCI